MRVFLQAVFGQILLNIYLLWRGRKALPANPRWRIPFTLCFVLEWLLYFLGYFFHDSLPESLISVILQVCNTWYFVSIYAVIVTLISEVLRPALRKWRPNILQKYGRTAGRSLFFLLVIGAIGLVIYARFNALEPQVRHVYLHVPKAVDGRDSLTIAMMCDMHFGEYIGKKQARHFVSMCNAQQPDLVVIVGDVIDYESYITEQAHIEEDLRQLRAPLGVYLTLGNHEYRANRHAKSRWMRKTGGTLLVDSVAMPDSAFYLVGRDDATNLRRASLHTLMTSLDVTKPVIVLDHQPSSLYEMAMNKADVGLHGHTHNGQLWPSSLLMKWTRRYECVYGYCRKGDTQFYVSSGIGCAGAPFRTGTRSELVILHLSFGK